MPFRNLLLDDEKACVLAVDDTPAILQLLEMALGIDYEVVTAESGAQALEIFPQRRFDLVLLDLLMPGMNGFETLAELQKLPSFNGTPVIFLTAMDDLASECSALEMGADDYITKPFKPNLVRLRIANILHRVRLQRHLSLALAGADQGLWSWDLASDQVRVAAGWSEPLGCANGEAAGEVAGWAALAHADCSAVIEQARAAYLAGERPAFEADVRLRTLKGGWKWFNIYGKSGNRQSLVGTYRNIDAKKAAELALRDSEERLRHVMDATGEGIWDWQVGSATARHNIAWSRILGLDEAAHEHEITSVSSLIHPDDRPAHAAALAACLERAPSFALEYRIRHASGNYLWVMDRGKVVERAADGTALRLVGAFQDISESKRLEEEYRRLALFDTLTGLPNRRLLVDRMEQAIVQNRRQASLGALMFIDMDRFKELNDSLGHDCGDLLLIEVGRRLQVCVRRMDTVARLGGDEFIVMLPLLSAEDEVAMKHAQAVGHKILLALGQPYRLGECSYDSSPSIGLTLFSGAPEESVDAVLKRADAAMYEAKHRGRNQLALAAPSPLT